MIDLLYPDERIANQLKTQTKAQIGDNRLVISWLDRKPIKEQTNITR